MNKKSLFSFILLILFWFTAFSQQSETVAIQWQNDASANLYSKDINVYPVFKNSFITNEWGLMPCFYKSFDIAGNQAINVTINEIETDTLASDKFEKYSDVDVLKDDWQIKITYTGKRADLYILPLKISSGKIIRLKKFKLTEDFIENGRQQGRYFEPEYTDNSVLSSGEWYKIGITKTGVYKLGYDDLANMGIDISETDPRYLKVYGQYNGMLPEANSEPRADDLLENAIKVVGEEDGKFDKNDYILFFGQGPLIWKYKELTGNVFHKNNLYSDTVYYFLNFRKDQYGKRITKNTQPQEEPSNTITSFLDYAVIDNDKINLLSSGKLWVGEVFNQDIPSQTFNFSFPNKINDKPSFIKIQVLAKGVEDSYFSIFVNDLNIIDSAHLLSVLPNSRYYAKKISKAKNFIVEGENLNVRVDFAGGDPLNTGWLDYMEISTYCSLKWRGDQMLFFNPAAMDSSKIYLYKLSNLPAGFTIWDITDKQNIKEQDVNQAGDTVQFKNKGKPGRTFMVFSNDVLYSPVSYKKIENQNLHSIGNVNMVIVVPDFLKPFAGELAGIHKNYDGLISTIVTPEQIYNEFSSGVQDVSAIRDFMRMLYLKGNFGDKPPYLLIFGDGSFDYKDRIPDNTNLIPVFESAESLQKTATYGTDDYYGILDDDEGQDAVGDLDVGIGRFPISSVEEAENILNKISSYLKPSLNTMQDWRNTICFIADDEDLNLHLIQAEGLADIVDTAYPEINENKIYIDAFTREKISSGYRYPEVNVAIDKQVEAGALIMNYTGHGGLDGWSAEKILTLSQIRNYDNFNELPLFITATCEFSRFDDPEFFSAGEQLLLNKNGGAISLLTTTRLAFAHANVILNRRIYLNLKNTEGNELPRLGDLIRMAKTPSHTNFLNFSLLGDPALKLAFSHYDIVTDSVISENGEVIDTITALSKVIIKGKIVNDGNLVDNFNGYLYPKIFDKKSKYTTRANSPKSLKQQFKFFDKILFDGKVTVKNGKFEFSFFVSDKLNPEFGNGKISYYAVDTVNLADATGSNRNIIMGGINQDAAIDNEGPEINLFFNDNDYIKENVVGKNSILHSTISDISGINYTGLGIGQDITLTIDNDYSNAINVNDLFKINIDKYDEGTLDYSIENLSPGSHKITLKAWDLQGNSSEKSIDFYIDDTDILKFKNFIAYPNPFKDKIIFKFESNLQKEAQVTINIYDLNGKKVGSSVTKEFLQYYSTIEFDWNKYVKSTEQQYTGIYFYEIKIEDENGFAQRFTGKIIKITNS